VLKKYQSAGVGYVEFSIGWSDMVEHPWIYRQLTQPITCAEACKVKFNFLAGFGRNEIVFTRSVRGIDGYATDDARTVAAPLYSTTL
jgi:hypothetical protein